MTEMSFIPMGTLVFLGYESDLVCVWGGGELSTVCIYDS